MVSFTSPIFISFLVICFSTTILAGQPVPPYTGLCCQAGQGTIGSPVANAGVRPRERILFYYYTRTSNNYKSYNYSVYLVASPLGTYEADQSAFSHLLAGTGDVTSYFYGRYPSGSEIYTPDKKFTIPDFSQPPWNAGPLSDLGLRLVVIEEWGEGASIGTRLAVASIPLIYNQTIPQRPDYPCPTLDRGNGTCGCNFNTICNTGVTGANTVSYTFGITPDRATCRDQCDSDKACDYYNYFEFAPAYNCFTFSYSASAQYDDLHFVPPTSSAIPLLGFKDQACKKTCA